MVPITFSGNWKFPFTHPKKIQKHHLLEDKSSHIFLQNKAETHSSEALLGLPIPRLKQAALEKEMPRLPKVYHSGHLRTKLEGDPKKRNQNKTKKKTAQEEPLRRGPRPNTKRSCKSPHLRKHPHPKEGENQTKSSWLFEKTSILQKKKELLNPQRFACACRI